jgi:hypothetical protein
MTFLQRGPSRLLRSPLSIVHSSCSSGLSDGACDADAALLIKDVGRAPQVALPVPAAALRVVNCVYDAVRLPKVGRARRGAVSFAALLTSGVYV